MTDGRARAQALVDLTLALIKEGAQCEDAIEIARRVARSDARQFFIDDDDAAHPQEGKT